MDPTGAPAPIMILANRAWFSGTSSAVNSFCPEANSCTFFRFTDDEVDEMYREAPIKNGMFDYAEFTRILKHGAKEKDEA